MNQGTLGRLRHHLAGAYVDVFEAAPFIDAPFLFRDLDHWNKVLDADTLKPIADEVTPRAT